MAYLVAKTGSNNFFALQAGRSFFVSPSGSDSNNGHIGTPFLTIAHGLTVLIPGDVLYLRAGTYAEAMINSLPSGTSSNRITISAYGGETVIIQPGSGSFIIQMTNGDYGYIDFVNIIFDGTGTNSSGVYVDGSGTHNAHNIRWFGGEMRHAGDQGFAIDNASGGSVWPDSLEWHGMHIHHNGSTNLMHGIYIEGNNCIIDGCEIDNNAGQGGQFFQQNGTPGSSCNNNTLRNCLIHDNSTVGGTRAGFTCDVGTGNKIYNNIFYNNPSEGLKVEFGSDSALIANNVFYGNGRDGLTLGFNQGFNGSGGNLGANSGCTNAVVKNNIAFGNKNSNSIRVFGSQNTLLQNNDTDFPILIGQPDNSGGTGTGNVSNSNISASPQFVRATNSDFHLRSYSPAVGAGQNLSSFFTTDINGLSRPGSGAWNLGPYQSTAVASPTQFYVSTTGSDSNAGTLASPFLTVGKGLKFVTAGDTLYLRGGTYAEALLNNIPSGPNSSNVVAISAYQSEVPILKASSGQFSLQVTGSNTSFVTFTGIVFDSSNITATSIYLSANASGSPSNFTFNSCEIKGATTGSAVLLENAAGQTNGHSFINCLIHDSGNTSSRDGMDIQSSNNIVDGCTFYNILGNAISVFKGTGVSGTDCGGNIIRNNTIHDTGVAGAKASINLTLGVGNVAYNNVVYSAYDGIVTTGGDSNTLVYNNTIYNCSHNGITVGLTGSTACQVIDNICYNNTNQDIQNLALATNSVIETNLIGKASIADAGTGTTLSGNIVSSNPLFVSTSIPDLHLTSSSPAKNAGVSTSPTVTVDKDGISRPQGSAYDIGAYEFH